MSDKEINDFIDKLHFRSKNHILDKLKNQFPDVDEQIFIRIIDGRLKDHFVKTSKISPYYIKIFSKTPNCWFHDLMDNGKDKAHGAETKGPEPRYWHIFIGTNNHYAVAYPLNNKSAASVKQTLNQFINEYHPIKLTSDEESAFVEKGNMKMLTDNKVLVHIITEQNHSALGIIDRFIRTLRDMNTPTQKSKRQSHDEKYKSITPKRMNKLINIYNSSYHSRIGCSPNEMFNNPDLEKEYIFKQLEKREKQEEIKDLHLTEGSFVRYIIPRSNGMTKKRYQYSHECYKIESVKGNMYTLIARDGTVMNLPRFKIMLCQKDGKKPSNIKWADTIPGTWNGEVKEILSFNERTRKYKVVFSVPGKNDYIDEIPESYLRSNFPQDLSELEKDYMQQK